ncbi:tripartite tricarboxylate transporter TctB family protein [Caproicibacter sp.]|uniref:tripartite tricarboxylate transporter TctB family protein n=1 Tax=Caproicibacter sp. TaxID=2814884 RepID=UPI0039895940
MTNMKKWNYIVSLVMALFGGFVILMSLHYPVTLGTGDPGAGFWPIVLGAVMIFLSALLTAANIANGEKEKQKEFTISLPANRRVYWFMALITLFCIVMYLLGFLAAVLLFIPASMYLLGVRNVKEMVLTSVISTAAIYVIFSLLLKTPLPMPFFME